MDKDKRILNELLADTFNDILTIERSAIRDKKLNDISITEIHTIVAIGMHEPKSMSQVASVLHITVGTLTASISNLVRKGYVERKSLEGDRRVVLIQLTQKGKLVYRLHERFHDDMINQIITGISDEEREVLVTAMEKVNRFFKEKYNLNDAKDKENGRV